MPKIQTPQGVVADYTADGWAEFRKWLDGTYAALRFVCADEGAAYTIVAPDGALTRAFSINKEDAAEFEALFLPLANSTIVGPCDPDKKPVVVISPATSGWQTFITGAGDKIPPDAGTTGRGMGTPIVIEFDGSEAADTTKTIGVQFLEPVEVHDGQLSWEPADAFSHKDTFSFAAYLKATVVVANALGEGNCNLYPVAPGWNVILPAAGDGAYDVDLSTATPVPDSTNSAYWNVEYATGAITPSPAPGTAKFNLFDFDVRTYLLKNIPLGNPMGLFDVDVYKVEYMHQSWTLEVSVKKHDPSACAIGGWVFTFRRYTT